MENSKTWQWNNVSRETFRRVALLQDTVRIIITVFLNAEENWFRKVIMERGGGVRDQTLRDKMNGFMRLLLGMLQESEDLEDRRCFGKVVWL